MFQGDLVLLVPLKPLFSFEIDFHGLTPMAIIKTITTG